MRIITGCAKGVVLKTLEGETTRPTASKVKEAVFSVLQFELEGKRILDLFAGSGQMGLEALSRGAKETVFVDKSKDAIEVIKYNAKKTKLEYKSKIVHSDYASFLNKNSEKFDIVFLDPPYAAKMYIPAISRLIEGNFIKPTTLIVCESSEENIFKDNEELAIYFEVQKHSKYGNIFITILKPISKSGDKDE